MGRGKLRVFLGAAPGVGKTYAMLEEGHRLAVEGMDVAVGFVEAHGRADTAALIEGLEVIPRRTVTYRGNTFEEMDLDAVLRRKPDIALIDELAHTNVPGSGHEKRWEDVEVLLAAGIDVITTLNIQHLESMNDVVTAITGVVQRETIPDEVVRRADEIEMVDLTQEGIRERMAAGKIYPAERIDAALANFFRPGNLGALRELALRGPPTGWTRRWSATARPTGSTPRGRPRNGWWLPSPASPGETTSFVGRRVWRCVPAPNCSGSTCAPRTGWPWAARPPMSWPASVAFSPIWAAPTTRWWGTTSARRWSGSPGPRTPPSWSWGPRAGRGGRSCCVARPSSRWCRRSGPIDVHVISHPGVAGQKAGHPRPAQVASPAPPPHRRVGAGGHHPRPGDGGSAPVQ